MYNYTITRFSCTGVFRYCFFAGVCFGGLGGMLIGILDHGMIGIFGGAFIGLLFGLAAGLFGAIFAAVFNALAPVTGGLGVYIEPAVATERKNIGAETSLGEPDNGL